MKALNPEGTPVIAIVGSTRSGSTIISRVVARRTGGTALGEIEGFPSRLEQENWRCSCGQIARRCHLWGAVLSEFKESGSLDELVRFSQDLRWWRLPAASVDWTRKRLLTSAESGLKLLGGLLTTLAQQTSVPLVISPKAPIYVAALMAVPSVDLRVIHVVRDSRATAYSWRRSKPLNPTTTETMQTYSAPKAAIDWMYRNLGTELVVRRFCRTSQYIHMRYEDFVRSPGQSLGGALSGIGWRASCGPADLTEGHVLGGNPSRFDVGKVAIREDREWETEFGGWGRVLTSALTWPMLLRYHYVGATAGEQQND